MSVKVGVSLFFQNYFDWNRYDAKEFDRPAATSDTEIYDEELGLGDLIEPLGYDAIWTVEHHHTPYTMIPDPTQLLSYYAGRTSKVDMGTMVMVLPWHNPLHVAENISLLDNLLRGRRLTIGFGRGASAKEYDPLGISMEDSREMFLEALDVVRLALTQERFSYDGRRYSIPETSVRPTPRSTSLTDRLYCSWGSPQTLPIAANAGLGMLIIPMKPWEAYTKDLRDYDAIREANGWDPLQPIIVCWIYCAEDPVEAQATAWTYMGNYWDSAGRHYGFASPDSFKNLKGYEYYQQLAEQHAQVGAADANAAFANTQIYGSPAQCAEKLKDIQRLTNASEVVLVFRYGGMPADKAEQSMRLFAEQVLPEIHAYEPQSSATAAS
jgi:alkanesulfonate monooxygenase SsuD/methylene tetrahydromethanopterin reductase-like flavin-dependent oxidoreductase (luciferase family)